MAIKKSPVSNFPLRIIIFFAVLDECTVLSLLVPENETASHVYFLAPLPRFIDELQQKNTCAHNSTQKAHANGIKKAKRSKYVSCKGMDPKFLRNQKFAKKYNGSKRQHD